MWFLKLGLFGEDAFFFLFGFSLVGRRSRKVKSRCMEQDLDLILRDWMMRDEIRVADIS